MNKKLRILFTALIVSLLMTTTVSAGNIGDIFISIVETLGDITTYVTTLGITSPTDGTRVGNTDVNITYKATNTSADVGYALNDVYMGNVDGNPFVVTGVDDGLTDGGQLNTVVVNVTDPLNGSAEATVTFKVDITAPRKVTNVEHTNGTNYINWTWTPPTNADFNNTIVNVTQGTIVKVPDTKIPKGINYFNATGLSPGIEYTMSIKTEDDAPTS